MEILLLVLVFWSVVPMLICGFMLEAKGRNNCLGVLFAFFLGWIAVIVCALVPDNPESIARKKLTDGVHKRCPECLSGIPFEARKCRHCGTDQVVVLPEPKQSRNLAAKLKNGSGNPLAWDKDKSEIPYHMRKDPRKAGQ